VSGGTWSSSREVARLVKRCLEEGSSVEIDGLGVFRSIGKGGYDFIAETRPPVFLAYAVEDSPHVELLFAMLRNNGFEPWMDRKKLMPGQNWPRAIERAIDVSSYFIACLSRQSVCKRGQFQAELRYALQCARRTPLGEIFFIPLRLDDCPVPAEIALDHQWVDMFPEWNAGVERVVAVMRHQERQRGIAA
jgi:hypothetical protein